jgi:hypothetical protein
VGNEKKAIMSMRGYKAPEALETLEEKETVEGTSEEETDTSVSLMIKEDPYFTVSTTS